MKPEKAKKTVYVQLKKERKKLEIIESRSKGSERNVSKKREKKHKEWLDVWWRTRKRDLCHWHVECSIYTLSCL